jgi:hypothetical protein
MKKSQRGNLMSTSRFAQVCLGLSYGCQWVHAGLASRYHTAKGWVSQKMESPPILYLREKLEGAGEGIKTALGLHSITGLALTAVSSTNPWYVGINATRYVFTSIVFAVVTYHHQEKRQRARSNKEKLSQLSGLLIETDKKFSTAMGYIHQADSILQSMGFPESQNAFSNHEIDANIISHSESKSICDTLADSKCSHGIKAGINSGIRSSMIYYAFDLSSELIPFTTTYDAIQQTTIALTFIISLFREYNRYQSDLSAELELEHLKRRMASAHHKIALIEKKIGTQKKLEAILKTAEEMTHLPTERNISAVKMKPIAPSCLTQLAESKVGQMTRVTVNGVVAGSAIHYLFEIMLPGSFEIPLIAGGLSWIIGSIASYQQKQKDDLFFCKMNELDEKLTKTKEIFQLTEKIIQHQKAYLTQLGAPPIQDEVVLDVKSPNSSKTEEEEADWILTADLTDLTGGGYYHSLDDPAPSSGSPTGVELGTFSKMSIFGVAPTNPLKEKLLPQLPAIRTS